MKQDITKLLAYEIESCSQFPLAFSFLLPEWVASVSGYELFFEPSDGSVGKDKMATESIELSVTIDNYGKHVIHDIVEPNSIDAQAHIEPIYFEPNCAKRVTGFLDSFTTNGDEKINLKLFLIVLKKNE